jgi:5-hydroxyisourate hydrolase-like protein (transthyretin family)
VLDSPAVVNGVVYVGDTSIGNVYAIGTQQLATTLAATAAPTAVDINTPFTINGTLNTTDGTAVAGATIQLEKNVSGTWNNVTTNVTNATGGYLFSNHESTAGTYYYRTAYDGNATYTNATSNDVSVNVQPVITPASSPAVTAQNANSLNLFVRGSDNSLWYKYWTGTTWTTAKSLGGTLAAGSSPAATSPGSGQVDISVLGTGNVLWWKTTTNSGASWSGWMSVGGI